MLLSRHTDANILDRVARMMGFGVVRGSTFHGGSAALRELAERASRSNLTITPDGPRGPRRRLAAGCVFLASTLQIPIVAMGFGYQHPWRLRTWIVMRFRGPGHGHGRWSVTRWRCLRDSTARVLNTIARVLRSCSMASLTRPRLGPVPERGGRAVCGCGESRRVWQRMRPVCRERRVFRSKKSSQGRAFGHAIAPLQPESNAHKHLFHDPAPVHGRAAEEGKSPVSSGRCERLEDGQRASSRRVCWRFDSTAVTPTIPARLGLIRRTTTARNPAEASRFRVCFCGNERMLSSMLSLLWGRGCYRKWLWLGIAQRHAR